MKKCVSILLCLALILAFFPGRVRAEEDTLFTDRDLRQEADLTDAETIRLENEDVTIDHAGVFLLSGSLENGQILVQAGEEDKVQLVLDGVNIHAALGPAIEVVTADKVFITLAADSDNSLSSDGFSEDGGSGVLYSKSDLTLNGTGQLTVTAQGGSGIVCKDTLAITGGSYAIAAAGHGITGKDALNIASGSFTITSGGGSTAVTMKQSEEFGPRGFNQGNATVSADTQEEETEVKAKGLKSDGPITVLDGSFLLDCADDALHAGGDVTLSGGSWTIRTADDGIHADENVIIGGGSFEIPYCYEGVEGKNVTMDGGSLTINSTDDGINATGEDTATGFRAPGMDTGAVITVNGGEITVVSGGDSLDSNGTIVLNGGTVNLTCNSAGKGNTALDSETGVTNNGAEVTTNDGSEQSGGVRGFGGGKGQMADPREQKGSSGSPFGGPFPGNGRQRPGNEDGQSSATPKGDDQPPANVDAVPSEGCACPSGSCGCIDNGGCACPFQTVG